jgi:magnesium chelatase family protein
MRLELDEEFVITRVHTATIFGLEAFPVEVEVEIRGGKGVFTIIGLADTAVRESRDRVISAIHAAGLEVPQHILVNLAPAELKKEGSCFDLAIALGIIAASGQLQGLQLAGTSFHGELSLDGKLKPVRGVVALAIQALHEKERALVVPAQNVAEASLIRGIKVIGASSLAEIIRCLRGGPLPELPGPQRLIPMRRTDGLSGVWGQMQAKRALLVAAAGAHNLLMIGPPGCGKSMLAERFSSLLPPLTHEEMLEVVKIHSIAGLPIAGLLTGTRPYRAPHQLISDVGLIGGGTTPRPGEISLAHRGVLFLDEFPEYRRSAIEALRAPLENGVVSVTRAKGAWIFPARFQLLAAMNPCPCGRLGAAGQQCLCSRGAVQAYLRKLSRPILDRIDLHVELDAVPVTALTNANTEGPQDDEQRLNAVHLARVRQLERNRKLNSAVASEDVGRLFAVSQESLRLLERAAAHTGISARGYLRLLRVARTIADLEGDQAVREQHVAEAIGFRSLERIERYCQAVA